MTESVWLTLERKPARDAFMSMLDARRRQMLDWQLMIGRNSQPDELSSRRPPLIGIGASTMAKPPKPIPPPRDTVLEDSMPDLNIGSIDVETSAIVVQPAQERVPMAEGSSGAAKPLNVVLEPLVKLSEVDALVHALATEHRCGSAADLGALQKLQRDIRALASG